MLTIETSLDLNPLIQEKTLERLGLEIIDLQDYTDESIPDNYPRYRVHRHGKFLGNISTSGDHFHTRIIPNLDGYTSLYDAVTCWISKGRRAEIESEAEAEIIKQQNSLPDYF